MITTFAEGLLWALIAIAATGIIVSIALIAALRKAELHTAELASRLARAEARLAEMDAAHGAPLHKEAVTDHSAEKICYFPLGRHQATDHAPLRFIAAKHKK